MFMQNFIWSGHDLHLCKWPKGTYITSYNFQINSEGLNIRLYCLELELTQPPTYTEEV